MFFQLGYDTPNEIANQGCVKKTAEQPDKYGASMDTIPHDEKRNANGKNETVKRDCPKMIHAIEGQHRGDEVGKCPADASGAAKR
jgi:hypothetical protein